MSKISFKILFPFIMKSKLALLYYFIFFSLCFALEFDYSVSSLWKDATGAASEIDFVFGEDKTSFKTKNLELGTYTLTLTTATNGQITYGENTGVGSLTITVELTEQNPTIEGEILISKKS